MLVAQNVCRFVGKLVKYKVSIVGEGNYTIGRGQLLLPDELGVGGQCINIVAWEDIAKELEIVKIDSWLNVLTSYTPSNFKGKLNDLFTVHCFKELDG